MNIASNAVAAGSPRAGAGISGGVKLAALIFVALACGQFAVFQQALAVLGSAVYPDTDDAMRMVQVRNLMHGQSWFDMTEWRLDPPLGVFSHWSRLIDAPLVVFIKAFGIFLAPEMAERAARVAWPLALTGLFYVAIIKLCGELLGKNRALHALLASFLTVPFQIQFQPGRIDHHSVQMILLTVMVWGAIASLARPRLAAACAAAFAISLAISLENLPFAPIIALPAVAWILHGERADRDRLLWFAGAAAIVTPAVFALTVAPGRWALPYNDALSGAHVIGIFTGAAIYLALASLTARLTTPRSRAIATSALGAIACALLAACFPALLRSPYADVDPLVRELWLNHVTEVQPIQVSMRSAPLSSIAMVAPLVIGLIGTLIAARRSRGLERFGWLALAVPLAIGVGSLFWMIRAAFSAISLAIPGLVYLGLQVQAWAARRTKHASEAAGFAFFILVTSAPGVSAFGSLVAPAETGGMKAVAEKTAVAPTQNCFSSETLGALDALPKGLVFGDVDLGPYLLAYTQHSALAGPYHRDGHGNRLVLQAMQAKPAALRAIIAESRADYVILCRSEMKMWTTNADQLSDAVALDKSADELRPVALPSDAIVVFKVDKSRR